MTSVAVTPFELHLEGWDDGSEEAVRPLPALPEDRDPWDPPNPLLTLWV